MKKLTILFAVVLLLGSSGYVSGQDLKINDLEYFGTQGVNVLGVQ